jgi:peroxiredoxin family protein
MEQDTAKNTAGFITSKDSIDGGYPALILAVNARRQGLRAKIFYTFMGINLIRKGRSSKAKFYMPGFIGCLPGMTYLSTFIMKQKIKKSGMPPLDEMINMAIAEGVEFIACKMTADMMGLGQEDFFEGVSIGNAEDFLNYGKDSKILLFT